jgi:hypothetical protein
MDQGRTPTGSITPGQSLEDIHFPQVTVYLHVFRIQKSIPRNTLRLYSERLTLQGSDPMAPVDRI